MSQSLYGYLVYILTSLHFRLLESRDKAIGLIRIVALKSLRNDLWVFYKIYAEKQNANRWQPLIQRYLNNRLNVYVGLKLNILSQIVDLKYLETLRKMESEVLIYRNIIIYTYIYMKTLRHIYTGWLCSEILSPELRKTDLQITTVRKPGANEKTQCPFYRVS